MFYNTQKYRTLVTPIGWAFSIWAFIFIGELLILLYLLSSSKDTIAGMCSYWLFFLIKSILNHFFHSQILVDLVDLQWPSSLLSSNACGPSRSPKKVCYYPLSVSQWSLCLFTMEWKHLKILTCTGRTTHSSWSLYMRQSLYILHGLALLHS